MEKEKRYFEKHFTEDYRLKLLSDGKLRTEDGYTFHIHKYMLAKNSSYFYAMFCGIEKNKNDILIPGFKGKVLDTILQYIYTGDIHVADENISELIVASDYFMLDDFLTQLKMILKKGLSIENCISVLLSSLLIQLKANRGDLLWESYRFVQTHFESLVYSRNENLGELPLKILKQLIGDRNLCVRDEKTVYIAIVKWVEFDYLERLAHVPDLVKCIIISDVDEDLASDVLDHDIIKNNPFCQDIIDIKVTFPKATNLEVLQSYLRGHTKLEIPFFDNRLPTKLNCICNYSTHNGKDVLKIYITYDENLDFWREILDISLNPDSVVLIEDSIYMLRTTENINFRYNVIEKQWYELDDFIIPRFNYAVVKLCDSLYVLGGISDLTREEIYDVEIYDSEFDCWYCTTPMIPISCFAAAPLNEFIYVIGCRFAFEEDEMIAQIYDAATEVWSLLPAPSLGRSHFTLAAYLEKLYVIGGRDGNNYLTDVEVFDPAKTEWKTGTSLPHVYYFPKAVVLNDRLIVYDNHVEDRSYLKTNPPVYWDVHQELWQILEESSPMNNIYMYEFLDLDNNQTIKCISHENRCPDIHFEKTPFA